MIIKKTYNPVPDSEVVQKAKVSFFSCPECKTNNIGLVAKYRCKCVYCAEMHFKYICQKCGYKIEFRQSNLDRRLEKSETEIIHEKILKAEHDLKVQHELFELMKEEINRLKMLIRPGTYL